MSEESKQQYGSLAYWNMVDVTDCDYTRLIQKAYALSEPEGEQKPDEYIPGDMSWQQAQGILQRAVESIAGKEGLIVFAMEKERGRDVNLTAYICGDGRVRIYLDWWNHTKEQMAELLESVGIKE